MTAIVLAGLIGLGFATAPQFPTDQDRADFDRCMAPVIAKYGYVSREYIAFGNLCRLSVLLDPSIEV